MSASDRVLEIMRPVVDRTISRLASAAFRSDPIGGPKYSRATSIMSSAYKRHGDLLGVALLECLRESPNLSVWREEAFRLSDESGRIFQTLLRPHTHVDDELPYEAEGAPIPLDVVVFDRRDSSMRSYNVKRGNGAYDGTKRRALIEQLCRTGMTLRSYGASMGFEPQEARAYIVFYYGLRSIEGTCSLVGDDLDGHFHLPVQATIEAVNCYFRETLHRLIESPHGAG